MCFRLTTSTIGLSMLFLASVSGLPREARGAGPTVVDCYSFAGHKDIEHWLVTTPSQTFLATTPSLPAGVGDPEFLSITARTGKGEVGYNTWPLDTPPSPGFVHIGAWISIDNPDLVAPTTATFLSFGPNDGDDSDIALRLSSDGTGSNHVLHIVDAEGIDVSSYNDFFTDDTWYWLDLYYRRADAPGGFVLLYITEAGNDIRDLIDAFSGEDFNHGSSSGGHAIQLKGQPSPSNFPSSFRWKNLIIEYGISNPTTDGGLFRMSSLMSVPYKSGTVSDVGGDLLSGDWDKVGDGLLNTVAQYAAGNKGGIDVDDDTAHGVAGPNGQFGPAVDVIGASWAMMGRDFGPSGSVGLVYGKYNGSTRTTTDTIFSDCLPFCNASVFLAGGDCLIPDTDEWFVIGGNNDNVAANLDLRELRTFFFTSFPYDEVEVGGGQELNLVLTPKGLGPTYTTDDVTYDIGADETTVTCEIGQNWFYSYMIGETLYFLSDPTTAQYTVKRIICPARNNVVHADVTFTWMPSSNRTKVTLSGEAEIDLNAWKVEFESTGNIYELESVKGPTMFFIETNITGIELDRGFYEWNHPQDITWKFTGANIAQITPVLDETLIETSAPHGLANGRVVVLNGVMGMTEINGIYATIQSVADTTFTVDIDSRGFGTYQDAPTDNYRSDTDSDSAAKIVVGGPVTETGSFRITGEGDTYNAGSSIGNHSKERILKCGMELDTTLKKLWSWMQFTSQDVQDLTGVLVDGAQLRLTISNTSYLRTELFGNNATRSGSVIDLCTDGPDLSSVNVATMLSGTANATYDGVNTTITLGGSPDLSGLITDFGHDLPFIRLTGSTGQPRECQWWPITSENDAADTVNVSPAPTDVRTQSGVDWTIWDRTPDIFYGEGLTGGNLPGLPCSYFTIEDKVTTEGSEQITLGAVPSGTLIGPWKINPPIGKIGLVHAEPDLNFPSMAYPGGGSSPPSSGGENGWLNQGGDHRGMDQYLNSSYTTEVYFMMDGNGTTCIIGDSSNSNIAGQTAAQQERDLISLLQLGVDEGNQAFAFMLRGYNQAWAGMGVYYGPPGESYAEYKSSRDLDSSNHPTLTLTILADE
ncbi:MAG: hypothetical protein IH987_10865 [Planctomycetes bacterium]|nr:hypothetical protein [Planctomycetota bacterium]